MYNYQIIIELAKVNLNNIANKKVWDNSETSWSMQKKLNE